MAAHVPRHARLGPQGRDHGRDLGRRSGYLGHPGQERQQAGVQAAGRAHQGKDSLLLLQALPRRPQGNAGRGAEVHGPGLHRLQDALRLRPRAPAAWREGKPEVGGSHPRSDRLRQRPDARVLHGLEPGVRQAHAAQAREVRAALAGRAGDRRRHRRLRRTQRHEHHSDLGRRA
ncbi:hypothetical protein D3C78_1432760 [compost metagenome]